MQKLYIAINLIFIFAMLAFTIWNMYDLQRMRRRHKSMIDKYQRIEYLLREATARRSPPKEIEGRLMQLKEYMSDEEIYKTGINIMIEEMRSMQE